MKHLVWFCLLAMPAWAADAPEWTIDSKASSLAFTAKQMSVPLNGSFMSFGGTIRFDPANLEGSRVAIDIQPGSADAKRKDVNDYLKTEAWFDVAKHPLAKYEATSFKALGGDRFEAQGKLTLHGVSRDLPLPFTLKISENGDKLRAEAKGETELKRLDFGIGSGEWRATDVVANEVRVSISVVAERSK